MGLVVRLAYPALVSLVDCVTPRHVLVARGRSPSSADFCEDESRYPFTLLIQCVVS
jgi:hypothetical protein